MGNARSKPPSRADLLASVENRVEIAEAMGATRNSLDAWVARATGTAGARSFLLGTLIFGAGRAFRAHGLGLLRRRCRGGENRRGGGPLRLQPVCRLAKRTAALLARRAHRPRSELGQAQRTQGCEAKPKRSWGARGPEVRSRLVWVRQCLQWPYPCRALLACARVSRASSSASIMDLAVVQRSEPAQAQCAIDDLGDL